MPDKPNPVYELLEQAVKNYEQAVQTSLRVQQESSKWWLDLMAQSGLPHDWQKRLGNLANEVLPLAQKRMEESIRLVEQTGRISLDLLKQSIDSLKAESAGANPSKMQDLWEASLQALRNNAQAIGQTNARILECWAQFFPRPAEAAAAPAAAPSAKPKGS